MANKQIKDLTAETTMADADQLVKDNVSNVTKKITWANFEGQIDHTKVANKGTNTHAQIDKVVTEQTKSISIENPVSGEDISWSLFDQAATITEIRAVLVGSDTPSVTWTIRHGTDRSAAGAEVVTGGTTTTGVTTGDTITSFNDETIVADSFVWIETTAMSGTVKNLVIIIKYTLD